MTALRLSLRRMTRWLTEARPLFWIGVALLAFWLVCALAGPAISPFDPLAVDPLARLSPPSSRHWLGTDRLGRDVFSRLIAGAGEVMVIAPAASLLGTVGGTLLGLAGGYRRGWLDEALNRVADAVLSIPVLLLGLLAVTAIGPSRLAIVLIIATIFTPLVMRTIRSAVLSEREREYVQL
ncbi:MAG: ABC transporter permease, partial [Thermomicrobium sp.]|nr:ABC transporter permease [Thermomicrobium sp.]